MIPQSFCSSLAALIVIRFGIALCVGGMEPVFQAWIARAAPEKDHGLVFGWITTCRSLGWMLSPLLSGAAAWGLGLRAVFLVGAALFLVQGLGIPALMRRAHLCSDAGGRPGQHP
jgi:MFS family permease